MDMNAFGRWALLNFVILPTRSGRSSAAYAKIWSKEGSPLLTHSLELTRRVADALGPSFVIELWMRYGAPKIRWGLRRLVEAGVDRIVVLPLFPQYSSAATGSAIERVCEALKSYLNIPAIEVRREFFDHPSFIRAHVDVARPVLAEFGPDHVLFSYHGLPVRHVLKSDPSGERCLARVSCCDAIGPENRRCYRAQCFATTRALAAALALSPEMFATSFQSRLGKTPWIEPYTDRVLRELRARGKKRLAILCPAFVADCLETLEEIGMGARDQWRALGGDDFVLVPSLNSHPSWVRAVVEIVSGFERAIRITQGAATSSSRA
jgi:ferrochelatase